MHYHAKMKLSSVCWKTQKECSLTFNPSQASSWSINRNYFPIKSEPRVSTFFFCLHLHNLPPWRASSVKVLGMLFVLIGPDISTSLEYSASSIRTTRSNARTKMSWVTVFLGIAPSKSYHEKNGYPQLGLWKL